jgi:putative transposase
VKLEITISEAKEIFKSLDQDPEQLFEMIRFDLQQAVQQYLDAMMRAELTHWLGREPYARGGAEVNHRNGFYPRSFTIKGVGDVGLLVPRDRRGEFQTRVLPRYRRYEQEISRDMSLMFLCGISTFRMRIHRRIEMVPVLAAIGVTDKGQKLVVGLQAGDKESAAGWREFFRDLKMRGLDGSQVTLGIMDGLASLEAVFREEFPQTRTQRCQVHVTRNVLAKVPRALKAEGAADLKPIFYASSRPEAMEACERFRDKWAGVVPSALASLERSLEACLTFFDFPADQWVSLRTTNIIERLHKEFRRRTRPMEILPGEAACYRLLAFISLKMELHWRSPPVGKVRKNLPFFQEMAHNQFTQES